MHITILLTLSIPPWEAELPVCVRYDAYLHPEPPGPDFFMLCKVAVSEKLIHVKVSRNLCVICRNFHVLIKLDAWSPHSWLRVRPCSEN